MFASTVALSDSTHTSAYTEQSTALATNVLIKWTQTISHWLEREAVTVPTTAIPTTVIPTTGQWA